MSADLLREAAALMRSRAEAAYGSPWRTDNETVFTANDDVEFGDGPTVYVHGGVYRNEANTAEHIASWHPAVALAVADWLDDALDAHLHVRSGNYPSYRKAVAVATAYLGRSA